MIFVLRDKGREGITAVKAGYSTKKDNYGFLDTFKYQPFLLLYLTYSL